jgi:hypothetical protein
MSGNGTAGEIGLYFSADKANGFAVINSLVPGTGPAPLSINPGAGQVRIGNTAALSSQTSSIASVRGNGNALEFGHNNQAGYGSTLGCQSSNGNPFLAFSAEAGTNINTYRTRGLKGSVVSSDLAGGFLFYTVPAANADNQAPTQLATLQTNGVFALPNASGSAAGTKFQSVSAQSKSVTNRDQSLWAAAGYHAEAVMKKDPRSIAR